MVYVFDVDRMLNIGDNWPLHPIVHDINRLNIVEKILDLDVDKVQSIVCF